MEKFKFKKNLGQNFLQDEKVLQKIVSSIECSKDDCIIEIGPGHGALTKYLVTNIFLTKIKKIYKKYI